MGSAVSEPPPAALDSFAARSSSQYPRWPVSASVTRVETRFNSFSVSSAVRTARDVRCCSSEIHAVAMTATRRSAKPETSGHGGRKTVGGLLMDPH